MKTLLSTVLFAMSVGMVALTPINLLANSTNKEPSKFHQWLQVNIDPSVLVALKDVDWDQVRQWIGKNSLTKEEIAELENQKAEIENRLNQRRRDLGDLQRKLDLVRLSP